MLTKPGIIYGNLLTATGGFLLASRGHISFSLLLATLTGVSLVIASACVFNNYIDRDIDKKMARTKHRALVIGTVSARSAMVYASLLGLTGFFVLGRYTNWLTVGLGLMAMFTYVILYGIAKRSSVHGTVVGSIAGALPPVAGYTAVANRLDAGALLLFVILVCWQMPHFYAIAMYRLKDYKSAGLPVLPVKKGILTTKIQIVLYVVAFIAATLSLSLLGYTGYVYSAVMGVIGLVWLWKGLQGFKATDDKRWARKMFLFSLIAITAFSLMLSINSLLT